MREPRVPTYESRTRATARQLEIWALLAEGKTNAEIGREIFLGEQTVKFHITNLFQKIGVTNRAAATAAWWRASTETWIHCEREVYTPFCPWCGEPRP